MGSAPWFRAAPPSPELAADLVTGWVARSVDGQQLVPDACVDLMWLDDTAFLCGQERAGWTFATPAGTEAVGLRFRPGRGPAVVGFHPDDVLDQRVPLADLLPRERRHIARELEDADSSQSRLRVMQAHARRWLAEAPPPDPLVDCMVHELARCSVPVSALARSLRVSERQLLRRCRMAFGYGPATLRRILRLQRFLRIAEGGAQLHLGQLAADAGYADQQHLARDAQSVAHSSPTDLLAARRHRPVSDLSTPAPQQRS
jgi:AraC-like DNA-binding protein